MSEIICPFCDATLFDSELEARECSSCMRKLPPNWLPMAGQSWRGRGGEEGGRGWESVRGGVTLLSVTAFVLTGVLLFGAAGVFLADRPMRGEPIAVVLVMLAGLGALLGALLGLIGFVTSLACPRRAGLRGLVGGTIGCIVAAILLLIAPFVFMELLDWAGMARNLAILAGPVFLSGLLVLEAAIVVYFAYLRGVARFFGDPSLGAVLLTFGIVCAVLGVLNIGALILFETFRFNFNRRDMEMILTLAFVLQGLALLLWLGLLLWKLRERIPPAPKAFPV